MSTVEIKNFEQFLQPILGPTSKILKISSYSIVPAGENYGGEILAVEITEETNQVKEIKHFVAKLTPSNEMLSILFNIKLTFKREVDIYLTVIPTLIDLQKEFNIPPHKQLDLFPKCYGARFNLHSNYSGKCDSTDNEIKDNALRNNEITSDALILFENLKTKYYVMEDRMTGFNFELTSYFLEKLARFHALPIALKHLKPDEFKTKIMNLNATRFGDSYTEEFKQQFITAVEGVINKIDDCKKYAKKIADKLEKGFKFEERFVTPTEMWGTLVHHDLWINNFLVRRDQNEKFVNLKLYDLQLACFGSFAHDLIFFLFTSVEQDVIDSCFDRLIKIYFDSFIECLKEFKIKTDVYTWKSFIDEINLIAPLQISHIVIMMRPIYMCKNKLSNNSEMDEKELGAINDVDIRYHAKIRKNIIAFVQHNWL